MKVWLALIMFASYGWAQISSAQIANGAGSVGSVTEVRTNPPVYPETYGASPSASAATNLVALQNAIYAAFGCGNGLPCRTNASGLSHLNRPLILSGLYHINGELQLYHVLGFQILCTNKLASGIVQDATNQRIFDGQNIAYGVISGCSFSTTANQTVPLIDIDNDHTHGADLSPQNITFMDDTFGGNGSSDVGVLIAKHGSDAQGDNIRCYNCYFAGFSGAGWQIGGNNTGRNVGRFYAQNAIKEQIIGGDAQGNPLYGIAVYGGSIQVSGMSMENDSGGFGTQTGADIYCEAPQDACVIENVRSESHILALSQPVIIRNSRTIFGATQWYNGSNCLAGSSLPVGTLFSGTGSGGDGAYYKVTVASSAFGGLCNTAATGGSSTTVTVSGTPWTTNAFTGYRATMWSGTGAGCYGVITSNTSSTITFSAGLVSPYFQMTCTPPDATTVFVVEPNWGTQTTSGGMTWAAFPFDAIGAALGSAIGPGSRLEDVVIAGGKIHIGGSHGGYLQNVQVSRSDWLDSAGGSFPVDISFPTFIADGISVSRPGTVAGFQLSSSLPRQGYSQQPKGNVMQLSGKQICWATGDSIGGTPISDVCFYPVAQPFANFPACGTITEGYQGTVTDSTTATYGGTITGGGTNHVHAYCNGTNWVVD